MRTHPEPVAPDPGLCRYAAGRLPPLLTAFAQEIEGVRASSEDIEYIHRMRVASRRLRAALPVFRPCFDQKRYARWMAAITRITRALGDARDADVQITYLKKYIRRHGRAAAGSKKRPAPDPSGGLAAAHYLLALLEDERVRLQPPVLKALDALERSGVVPEMNAAFQDLSARSTAGRHIPPLHGIPMVAARRIAGRTRNLLSFEPWVSHPEAVAEHHATRIAAKKLRYTLEIYGVAYRNGLRRYILRAKRLQEILGDLHDCDVWIDRVIAIRLKERTLLRSHKRTNRPDPAVLASLAVFLAEKERERRAIHRRFTAYWAMLRRTGVWEELAGAVTEKQKNRYRPPGDRSAGRTLESVEAILATCPGVADHSRTVTRLALMLFDSLAPLHKLGRRDRFLLECAALLHDTGWTGGRAGHGRRGAARVLGDGSLPFDLCERGIVTLAISCHRGQKTPAADPLFSLLPEDCRRRSMVLTAILRAADGLDYLHTGNVQEVHAVIGRDAVVLDILPGTGCSAEKARAQAKSSLFAEVFGVPLVIR